MNARALYVRVGVLVVVGLGLAAGFLLFLAGGRTSQAELFETYSQESVQGLDVGAPVRYRGVAVGRVTAIRLAAAEYPPPPGTRYTDAFRLVLIRFSVDTRQLGELPSVDEAIRLGLRARISAQGITGVNYVELDFVNPERYPVEAVPWTPRDPVIPAIPSTVAQVRSAAEQLMERLSEVPLERIIGDLSSLLEGANHQMTQGDLAASLREAARSMAVLRQALEDGHLTDTLADLHATVAEARALLGAPELRQVLERSAAAAADIRRVIERLPPAMESLERTLRSARGVTADVQSSMAPILADLRATVSNLRAATEQLRASPSQLLFGAPPTPERRR